MRWNNGVGFIKRIQLGTWRRRFPRTGMLGCFLGHGPSGKSTPRCHLPLELLEMLESLTFHMSLIRRRRRPGKHLKFSQINGRAIENTVNVVGFNSAYPAGS